MKLKANTRFLNAMDGKIYDKGDEFTVKTDADADYFTAHKIASEVKELKEPKQTKEEKHAGNRETK